MKFSGHLKELGSHPMRFCGHYMKPRNHSMKLFSHPMEFGGHPRIFGGQNIHLKRFGGVHVKFDSHPMGLDGLQCLMTPFEVWLATYAVK